MSDRVVQSVNETSGGSVQPMQTYQSVWMSHWMRTSCKATPETLNLASGNGEMGYGVKDNNLRYGLDVLTPGKGPDSTNIDSTNMGTERLGFGSSVFKQSGKTDDMQLQRAVTDGNFEVGKDVDVNKGSRLPPILRGIPYSSDTSSRGFHPLDEGTSNYPLEWMKDHPSAKESCFMSLKPSQETFAEPSSLGVLYKHDLGKYELRKGKSEVSSLICGAEVSKNQFQKADLRAQEHISCNKHSRSADLVCEGNKDTQPQSKIFTKKYFGESNESLLFDVPSTSHNHLPAINQEWFQKMQKCSGLRPYPGHYIVSEETEAKKSYYNRYALPKLPNCLRNVETMRICTTVEEGNLRGYPRFSQTSRSVLIAKTTDFNLSNEFDCFDATRIITEVNGNIASQGKRGAILQQLSSSAESERKGHVGGVKARKTTTKNESSDETDSMDMDNFKKETQIQAFNLNSDISYPVGFFSSRETESRGLNTKLLDINLELPALPATAASSENSGPSSSKTQSLEMDTLMAHAEPSKPNFNLSLEISQESDPGDRWVKRLKLSSSQSSSQGTNNNVAENSHDKKMKRYFGIVPMDGIPSTEPYLGMRHGKESMALHDKGTLSRKNTEIMVSPTKKSTELFSQPWIQRWLHDESHGTREYTETKAVCAPQSSKLAMEDDQKEQFPSLGAMAMMGKAMRGFQPCDLQKRGSFTVWNTKAS
ncbi:hypothetical protein F511_07026 [Dorcoceras hygrometricum]|uniref:F-box protein n=1 Tax=Dorcoceras hygrometricum TaxID=472368 RepID=A0A2Z7CZV5_9LAMI|nr:hypothetical protein F511_07026 [Dorcoceras hygrometricum]